MSTVSTAVPAYVNSKVKPYFDENSLFLRALALPRSVFNMVNVFTVTKRKTSSFVAQAYGYSTWIVSRLWHVAPWRVLKNKELSKDKGMDEPKAEIPLNENIIMGDYLVSNFPFSCVRNIYLHFLEHNFLEITRESLELLRYESEILQGLQDFELVKVLKGLFGCQPSQEDDENNTESKKLELSFITLKDFVWTATTVVWRTVFNRIACYSPVVAGWGSYRKDDSEVQSCTSDSELENNDKEVSPNCSQPTSNIAALSAGSLLLCESNLFTKVLTDSGTYALTSTHDLLKEALLLFVPMEILENTTELLKNPTCLVSTSPLSAFWQLYNYVSIWGLDILDECCNQPDIEYAIIDDDDFHFVVNVPTMRRPILFIGIR